MYTYFVNSGFYFKEKNGKFLEHKTNVTWAWEKLFFLNNNFPTTSI